MRLSLHLVYNKCCRVRGLFELGSLPALQRALLVCVDDDLFVDDEALALADVLDEDLGRVLGQDVADAVIFKLFFRHRNEEGVLVIDQEPIENELRIGHALALQAYTFVELEGGDQRDQRFQQEVI